MKFKIGDYVYNGKEILKIVDIYVDSFVSDHYDLRDLNGDRAGYWPIYREDEKINGFKLEPLTEKQLISLL
jgi:hypothetical protein